MATRPSALPIANTFVFAFMNEHVNLEPNYIMSIHSFSFAIFKFGKVLKLRNEAFPYAVPITT
jgi:hypothetical protein